MKINTINRIKKELEVLPRESIIEYCLKMAKYKKENKELLNYLLFEAHDEAGYVNDVKEDLTNAFAEINKDSFFYVKKNIRRILRTTTKHIKHSGIKETEIELLLFFCTQMQNCGVSFSDSKVMLNLYERQIKNIHKALNSLHEDIRLDYEEELDNLERDLL